jgi:hypothetical protein
LMWNDDQPRASWTIVHGWKWNPAVRSAMLLPLVLCVCVCVWCVVERVECKYFFHLFEHRARAKRDFFPRRVYIRIDRSGGGERRTRGTKKKKRITHACRVRRWVSV